MELELFCTNLYILNDGYKIVIIKLRQNNFAQNYLSDLKSIFCKCIVENSIEMVCSSELFVYQKYWTESLKF